MFSTAADNQPSRRDPRPPGRARDGADNKSLGRFILDGILPAPRGVPQVEVTFDLDANGILNVSARDKATGKEQKITITAGGGLSKEEVEKLQKEAELHASEDKQRRDEIEIRNTADSLAYQAEKTVRENGDKIDAELKSEVEGKMAAVRSAAAVRRRRHHPLRDGVALRSDAAHRPGGVRRPGRARRPRPGAEVEPGAGWRAEEGTVEGEFREV